MASTQTQGLLLGATKDEDVKSLVDGLVNISTPSELPKTKDVLNQVDTEGKGVPRLPTLTAVLDLENKSKEAPKFSEDVDSRLFNNAIRASSVVDNHLRNLGNKSPEQRALVGARVGAGTGLAVGGPIGALIGASVGSYAGRGLGKVQSGEHAQSVRNNRVMNTMKVLDIVNDKNISTLSDNNFLVTNDPNARLRNTSRIAGKPTRGIFEIDKTSPFSKRTTAIARPLAWVINEGTFGVVDKDQPKATKTVDDTTGLLVNMFEAGSDSMDTILKRAQTTLKKLGVTEDQMRSFFDARKGQIDEVEAREIERGIGALYA